MATYSGTPKTWTAGETLLASDFNAEIRDPLAALTGAWTSWTPTISTSTLGNGTPVGKYIQVGKFVAYYASFTLGSTSAISTTIGFSVPVTAVATGGLTGITQAMAFDTSTSTWYQMEARFSSSTVLGVVAVNSSGTYPVQASTSTTVPFTWATGDIVRIAGIYEAA